MNFVENNLKRRVVAYTEPNLVSALEREEYAVGLVDKYLAIEVYDHALIFPGVSGRGGGVTMADGTFVQGTSLYDGVNQCGAYACERPDENGSDVIYIGMFHSCWGHCITDFLQHLWFLNKTQQMDEHLRRLRFAYTVSLSWGRNLPNNFFEILRLLGVKEDQLVRIERPTRFNRVYVPESCFWHNLESRHIEWTMEYSRLIDRIICVACGTGAVSVSRMRRVYFSRTGWRMGREFGERNIEKAFEEKGFEIVHPEKLSLVETIQLLQSVRTFAATDGSCGHNAIFLPRGAESVIVRKANYVNKYQAAIHRVRELSVVYVDANFSKLFYDNGAPMLGPFFLCITEQAAKYFGVRPHFPILLYVMYLIHYAKHRLLRALRRGIGGRVRHLRRKFR